MSVPRILAANVPKSERTELRIFLVRALLLAVFVSVCPFPRQNGYCKLVIFSLPTPLNFSYFFSFACLIAKLKFSVPVFGLWAFLVFPLKSSYCKVVNSGPLYYTSFSFH